MTNAQWIDTQHDPLTHPHDAADEREVLPYRMPQGCRPLTSDQRMHLGSAMDYLTDAGEVALAHLLRGKATSAHRRTLRRTIARIQGRDKLGNGIATVLGQLMRKGTP